MRRIKKKWQFLYIGGSLYIGGRAILIATSSNLLDTKYVFYGFNDNLRDTTD